MNFQAVKSDIEMGFGVRSKRWKHHYLIGKLFGPFSFINISEGREEVDDVEHSSRNLVEVAVLMNIVQRLHKGKPSCEL